MTNVIDKILNTIEDVTKDLTIFLDGDKKTAQTLRKSTKLLYDFTKKNSATKTNSLPELVIDGFDEEQIWQQIDLQNEQVIPFLISDISKLLLKKDLAQPLEESEDEESESQPPKKLKGSADEDVEEESDQEFDQESDNENGSKEESFSETESTAHAKGKNKTQKRKVESSIVDDKFFKMQRLNEYLIKEDRKETKGQSKNADQSDDESIDLFNGYSDKDSGDEETQKERDAIYADFFDSPDSDGEVENKEENQDKGEDLNEEEDMESEEEPFQHSEDDQESSKEKRVKFNLPVDSDDSSKSADETEKDKNKKVKSSLEERQERLEKKMRELEEQSISEKPWQLKGEVGASGRPQDSLLEDFVEVDVVSRPPPVITEQTTLKLEDIIRQRIKDKAWDDVEKKVKPVDTPAEYKKKLIMDQEKSKLSLAEIYEKDFVKQREALNPDQNAEVGDPPEHIELKKSMHSLFRILDALSNFHYTPRPVQPELKIISNVPAINMEEVAPVATSDATLLAPEEIRPKKRGELLGKAERTKTDMKRELRKKKKKQREIQQAKEKKEKLRTDIDTRKKRNKETAKVVQKLTKSRNVLKMDEQDNRATKSSTAFFNQLQDEVQSQIKAKTSKKPGKKEKSRISAVKLKL
ncbi:U3 small nucleolar ribonucleoprotein protein MPP10 [Belonocnema kinseyi]|uniref:U3 small nucleolar ribonucleoprotein protein MPP10 n=1 Tax=Belonocnema kinseyi TaxID=2817044 RepID=UPI00143D9CCB|nr:U3 small nucleolar ribonucleoprotein protein MPP10 [Belonocnema kinseyi]